MAFHAPFCEVGNIILSIASIFLLRFFDTFMYHPETEIFHFILAKEILLYYI